MRPAEFTEQQVITAGAALQAAGRNVTGFALRKQVGGGNPMRLRQIWDEHVGAKKSPSAKPDQPLPDTLSQEVATVAVALTEHVRQLAGRLHDQAIESATAILATETEATRVERQRVREELQDAAVAMEDREARLEDARAETEALHTQLTDVKAQNLTYAVERALQGEQLATLERTHKIELARLQADLVLVSEQRDTAARDCASAREESARLRGQVEVLERQQAQWATTIAARR